MMNMSNMSNGFRRALGVLGSMKLAVGLLFCAAVLFFAGAVCYQRKPDIFVPLNAARLPEWIATYGMSNPEHTWWLFLLIGVFTLLGVNTFVCTLERMVAIIRSEKRRFSGSLLCRLSPHAMHIGFLAIVSGYLIFYLFGVNSYNNILKPGFVRLVPGSSVTMELRDPVFSTVSDTRNEHLKTMNVSADYSLVLRDGDRTTVRRLGLNRPCFYRGYSFHVVDFRPTSARASRRNVWVNLTIRKNAGIPVVMAGILLFVAGAIPYVFSAFRRGGSPQGRTVAP